MKGLNLNEFDDPEQFHKFLDSDAVDVRNVSVINDQLVEVHYEHKEEDIPISPTSQYLRGLLYDLLGKTTFVRSLRTLG